jgi:hypothetical protein
MPGLVPGIHVFCASLTEDVDGRVKPGHDEGWRTHGNARSSNALTSPLARSTAPYMLA